MEYSQRGGQVDPLILEGREIAELTRKAIERMKISEEVTLKDEDLLDYYSPLQRRDEFDCESIISSRSSSSRYTPKTIELNSIKVGKVKKEPQVVLNVTGTKLFEVHNLQSISEEVEVVEFDDEKSVRKPGETAEERKARKSAVKEVRRQNRQRKKTTKESYKKQLQQSHHQQVLDQTRNPRRVRI